MGMKKMLFVKIAYQILPRHTQRITATTRLK